MKYYLLNPTGNITALIPDDTPFKEVMDAEPSCEQAGYISYNRNDADIYLCMSGGEFCGNATMCAAYLTGKKNVKVFVEGTGIVGVVLNGNEATVDMPKPYQITKKHGYPLVRFKGIDHYIIEDNLAPKYIKEWCEAEATGFMYLQNESIKPLVYVKGADTLFWENSCASGSTAVGHYLNRKVEIKNPAGILKFDNGYLTGSVSIIKAVL